jgi:hypothetical protein
MLRHRYILFPSKLPTDDSSRCGFPRHIIPRIPSPWKDAIVEIAITTARLGKSPHTTPIPAIMVAATANTPSPPAHLLIMILFAIATPKIISTVP